LNALRARRFRQGGYTLIELVLVAGIIVLILSIAMPALLPAFAFSELEGSARHLASYGRSAIAYSALTGEPITVKVDLEKGRYWAVQWRPKREQLFDAFGDKEQETFDEAAALKNVLSMQNTEPDAGISEETLALEEQYDRFFQRTLEARAKNVKHDGIFADADPLFEEDFKLKEDDEENYEEVNDQLLLATTLPDGVVFDSVLVGAVEHFKGTLDFEVSPLGLMDNITFYLLRGEDDYFTVIWDPITGNARIRRGKEIQPQNDNDTPTR